MDTLENVVLNAAETIDPTAPIVEAASAVAATIANPTPAAIANDFELAFSLIAELKNKISVLHPSVYNYVKNSIKKLL